MVSPEDKNDSFQRLLRFAGSRKNLSICRALVLIDMSNTFSPNSTTSPPRILGSIWHMQKIRCVCLIKGLKNSQKKQTL